ncbi:MAG: UDP-N-acetylmuramyl-tripeptide synthetase, partial [Niameybacter sp.]
PEGAYQVEVPIPGKFTVYNTLAVICTARQLGLPMEFILDHMKVVRGVPGRVQSFSSQKGYSVLVDYAHTPDGLENVLETIKQFVKGRIITVFGCGGDRDNTKRPLMGEVAARYSDEVIITSDNPRSEDPLTILEQVEVGVKRHQVDYVKMEDRKEAICQALNRASEGDVVLIAGKGHENYQILKERIIHFDDSEIVRAFIQGEE